MNNHYQTLSIPNFSAPEIVKKAYRTLSKKYHPDMNNGDKRYERKFIEVQAAYDVLADTTSRYYYDLQLKEYLNPTKTYDTYNNQSTYDQPYSQRNYARQSQYKTPPVKPAANWAAFRYPIIMLCFWLLRALMSTSSDSYEYKPSTVTFYDSALMTDSMLKAMQQGVAPSAVSGVQHISKGTSMEDVLRIQGQPTLHIDNDSAHTSYWQFGSSSLWFKDGKVSSVNNAGGNLNVNP